MDTARFYEISRKMKRDELRDILLKLIKPAHNLAVDACSTDDVGDNLPANIQTDPDVSIIFKIIEELKC